MHPSNILIPLFATLVLAGCSEDQTAQAPTTPAPPPTTTAERPATPPAPAAPAPPSTTAGSTPTAPTAPATPPSSTASAPALAPAAPPPSQSAAATPANLDTYRDRTYSAGPVSLVLKPDNTFEMMQTAGDQKVTGRYAYENGIVTLSDPQGPVGDAQFPMRCRFETVGTNEFRLAENNGSCTRFKDLTFKPAAG